MAKFGFTDNDGADVGEKYVSKEYAIDVYPNIFTTVSMAGLYTWGNNQSGQLGNNTLTSRSSPGTTAGGGLNWRAVTHTQTSTSCAVKNDGTLWTWGSSTYGALGNNLAIGNDRSSPGTTSGGGTDWASVANGGGGDFFLAAIKTNGTLWTWGRGAYGKLGSNGTGNRSSPNTTSGGGTDWTMASCGYYHMVAVKSDGTLWTWGRNNLGQLGTGGTANRSSPNTTSGGGTNWVFCSAGGAQISGYSAAIKSDGTLWTWGDNSFAQLGTGTTTNRSSPGTTSGGGTNWKSVACAPNSTAAIKTDGTLWTWGSNNLGILGDNTTTARSSPGTVAGGGANWVRCSMGFSTFAIKADGTLWTWGSNSFGDLGDGTTNNRSSPGTTAGGGTHWKFVFCAGSHGTAINEEDGW